jgi:hypothetical protein
MFHDYLAELIRLTVRTELSRNGRGYSIRARCQDVHRRDRRCLGDCVYR